MPLRTADGGWVPGVEPEVTFVAGAGDGKVMNYHYRVTVSKSANRIPFPCPEGYDEGRFEILARYFHEYPESTMRRIVGFINNPSGRYGLDAGGNTVVHAGDKWELNNHQASILSLDHLGGQFHYPDADRALRKRILADHHAYNAGLLYFLCQSPLVPAHVRSAMQAWGLPPDEPRLRSKTCSHDSETLPATGIERARAASVGRQWRGNPAVSMSGDESFPTTEGTGFERSRWCFSPRPAVAWESSRIDVGR